MVHVTFDNIKFVVYVIVVVLVHVLLFVNLEYILQNFSNFFIVYLYFHNFLVYDKFDLLFNPINNLVSTKDLGFNNNDVLYIVLFNFDLN